MGRGRNGTERGEGGISKSARWGIKYRLFSTEGLIESSRSN